MPRWGPILLAGLIGLMLYVGVSYGQKEKGRKKISPKQLLESMALVKSGWFEMGSFSGRPNEGPAHEVYLDNYMIDRTEVTNSDYASFLNSGGSDEHWDSRQSINRAVAGDRYQYTVVSGREFYPATYVSWYDAVAFAQWARKRLPTEAEWEKAARGEDGRLFPWGNRFDRDIGKQFMQLRAIEMGVDSATIIVPGPIREFPKGVSPYGVFDMAGNAGEWVHDWYNAGYYGVSPKVNPRGPGVGVNKAVRGLLSAVNYIYAGRVTTRAFRDPNGRYQDVGFRCVMEPPEEILK